MPKLVLSVIFILADDGVMFLSITDAVWLMEKFFWYLVIEYAITVDSDIDE